MPYVRHNSTYERICLLHRYRHSIQFTCYRVFIIFHFSGDCDKDGTVCSNGACLDSQCHCNDGFGGCNCQVPGMYEFYD